MPMLLHFCVNHTDHTTSNELLGEGKNDWHMIRLFPPAPPQKKNCLEIGMTTKTGKLGIYSTYPVTNKI